MEASLELLEAKIALLGTIEARPASTNSSFETDETLVETQNLMQELLDEIEREIRMAEKRHEMRLPVPISTESLDEAVRSSEDLVTRLYELSGDGR